MNRRKETYKLGRKMMNLLWVPMTRTTSTNESGIHKQVILRLKHNLIYNQPIGDSVHGFNNEIVNVKKYQVRLRRPKTEAEVRKYYRQSLRSAISSTIAGLHSRYDKSSKKRLI